MLRLDLVKLNYNLYALTFGHHDKTLRIRDHSKSAIVLTTNNTRGACVRVEIWH